LQVQRYGLESGLWPCRFERVGHQFADDEFCVIGDVRQAPFPDDVLGVQPGTGDGGG
jgi:hypothetical protein